MGIAGEIAAVRPGDGPTHQENLLSPQSRRHIEMRVAVLKAHPEAANLAGADWRGLIGAIDRRHAALPEHRAQHIAPGDRGAKQRVAARAGHGHPSLAPATPGPPTRSP